jgi:arginase family enzyme
VLDRLGATAFSLDDVLRDGMRTVAQEALEVAASGTEAVYLSVDLGVVGGLRDPVGLEVRELVAGVRVVSSALLAAADICGGGATGSVATAGRVAAEIAAGAARRLS